MVCIGRYSRIGGGGGTRHNINCMHGHDIGGAFLKLNPNFCSLDGNPIGDRGAEALAVAMKTMNLQALL